jgi:hypothetical protein
VGLDQRLADGAAGMLWLTAQAWKAGIVGTSRDEYGRLVLGDIIRAANGQAISEFLAACSKLRVVMIFNAARFHVARNVKRPVSSP